MAERDARREAGERAAFTRLIAATIISTALEIWERAQEARAEAARLQAQAPPLRGEARLLRAVLAPDPPDE